MTTAGAITIDGRIDQLERAMIATGREISIPVEHLFTPGLYIRTFTPPAGAIVTSKVHKTEHPFFLLRGRLRVRDNDGQWAELVAPHVGVTPAGTRRVAEVLEDVVWVTVHATDLRDPAAIEAEIIHKHDEHLIESRARQRSLAGVQP